MGREQSISDRVTDRLKVITSNDQKLTDLADLCERVAHPPLQSKTVRRYQFRNIRDLGFDSLKESGVKPSEKPSVLPFFIQNDRYRATAVLEESVIDNECIKQTAFLRQFDGDFVDDVMACDGCVRAIVFLPNQVIVREGEKGDSMMVIAKGEVEVSVQGVPIKRLGEGSFFGELVFVGATDVRTATITAVTFCDVRLIYKKAFTTVIKKYPDVEARFKDVISGRMAVVQQEMSKTVKTGFKRRSLTGRLSGSQRSSMRPDNGQHAPSQVSGGDPKRNSRLFPTSKPNADAADSIRADDQTRIPFGKQQSIENRLNKLKEFRKEYGTSQAGDLHKNNPELEAPSWAIKDKEGKEKDDASEGASLPPLNNKAQKSPRKKAR